MSEAQLEERKIGMRDKPAADMTREELRQFMRGLGLPGLYFPMADLVKNNQGGFTWELGMIHTPDHDKALWIPSEQPLERVYGKLLRDCPTPQMMLAFRKLVSRLQPDSENMLVAIFGDPSSGKSHIIKEVGAMVYPTGCTVVDCGGLNMRELFWRTVIDYGQGVKEQLEKKAAEGKVMQSSLDLLESSFPGSVVRDEAGAVKINWDAVGARRQEIGADGKLETVEDRGDAALRATNLLRLIYEREGIAVQSNAFGIKTVEGEIFESFKTGQPIFLDEFNKCQRGTLDAYQNFLEWVNGNDKNPVLIIANPMATTDKDSPAYLEFDRRKRKLGWFMGLAGNDPKDGATTQALSESMEARLNIIRIGDPSLLDWEHRYSQILTGFPLKPWYDFFEAEAKADPAGFAKMLVNYRLLGLTAAERRLVPPHQIEALKNFQSTVEAIRQMAEGYHDQQQLSKPESAKANDLAFKNCQNELAVGRKNIRITFRTAINELRDALRALPEVLRKGKVALVSDLAAAFQSASAVYGTGFSAPAWHRLGANLVRVRQEAIANATVDMPQTQAALVTLWETNGVFPAELKEAKKSEKKKPLVDLLSFDDMLEEGLGNREELEKKRGTLLAALKSIRPDLQASPEQVIPLKNLALALKEVEAAKDAPTAIVMPNTDFNAVTKNPVVVGEALPNYDLKKPLESAEYELVDFRAVLASLAVDGYAERNRERIWPVKLIEKIPAKDRPSPEDQRAIYDALRGKSDHGFDICILAAAGNDDRSMKFLYVIEDKARKMMIVAGPEPITPELTSELAKKNITYVVKSDPATAERITNFMGEGHVHRLRNSSTITKKEKLDEINENLVQGFSAICREAKEKEQESEERDQIPEQTNVGMMIVAGERPNVFTSFVTRKKGIRL